MLKRKTNWTQKVHAEVIDQSLLLVMQAVKINGNLLHLSPHIAKQKTRMAYFFFLTK